MCDQNISRHLYSMNTKNKHTNKTKDKAIATKWIRIVETISQTWKPRKSKLTNKRTRNERNSEGRKERAREPGERSNSVAESKK